MTLIAIIILAIWTALTLTVIGLCFAASLGDRAQQEPISPAPPQPEPHTARRQPHAATVPAGLRSPQQLSAR